MPSTLELITYPAGPIETNGYLVIDPGTKQALIIDAPSGFAADVQRDVADRGLTVTAIVVTHGHWDHIGDTAELKRTFGMPVLTHTNTVPNSSIRAQAWARSRSTSSRQPPTRS